MHIQTFSCPQCGGAIEYQEGSKKTVKCRFCHSTVIVPQELRPPARFILFDLRSWRAALRGPDAPPIKPVVWWAVGAAVVLVTVVGLLVITLNILSAQAALSNGGKTPQNQAVYLVYLPTPTSSLSLTPLPIAAPSLTATLSPSDPCLLGLFRTGVTRNAQWEPCLHDFSGTRMALVPKGCFTMGSDASDVNQQPPHRVCFTQPFWIGVGEVTQGQFRVEGGFAGEVPYYVGDALPRELITWEEASAFCQKEGGDLPTEAQWEYAARGPDDLLYPWGNIFVRVYAVYSGNSNNQTAPVFARPGSASWVGAMDMLGNVYEWVADWYGPYSGGDQTDPTGPANGTYRVLRGGSFRVAADQLTATARSFTKPFYSSADLGFRCARPYP